MRTRFATLASTVMLAAIVAAACESPQTKERLAQMAAVSAEKDSLLQLMSENVRLMTEISTELAKVKDIRKPTMAVGTVESPMAGTSYRDSLKAKVTDVVQRVNSAEERLAASQRRIRTLSRLSDSLRPQLELAQQAAADLQATMENQRSSIAAFEQQVAALTQERMALTEEKTALTQHNLALGDTLKNLDTENNKVYYLIGTKDELKEKGVITEEGKKFLFFGGKTVVPSRSLDPSLFTAVDRREVAEVPLPDPEREYKIVSRQNLDFLADTPEKNGKVKGALHITAPEQFWAPSRFLIIVQS